MKRAGKLPLISNKASILACGGFGLFPELKRFTIISSNSLSIVLQDLNIFKSYIICTLI